MEPVLAALALAIAGYMAGSVKVINQGNQGIVERLGRFQRVLNPGLNFVIPMLDSVLVESTREQLLDIDPQQAITRDNVPLTVDAIVYWQILDVQKAYYAVQDLEEALKNLVITTVRSEVGRMDLKETVSSRGQINRALLNQLDEATEDWGVKVKRVEVQEITPSTAMLEALEQERVAESRRKADIAQSQGTVQSIELISDALRNQPNAKDVLKYLLTQRYVEANMQLGESPNSKIIFMDPKSLTETIGELIGADTTEIGNDSNERS